MKIVRGPRRKVGSDRGMSLTSPPPARLSRRAAIGRGVAALAAACALGACSTDPGPEEAAALATSTNTKLAKMINGDDELVIAGQPMDVALLQQFYARHGFEPVWTDRQDQVKSLVDAVSEADDHGLDADLFYLDLLQRRSSLPPLERDLLLSRAFLSYADALARGAVPVERRPDYEALTPGPVNVPAALDAAINSPDPGAEIEALAPSTATYRVLRETLRGYRSGSLGGSDATPNRLRQIVVNLERQRWLPRQLPGDRTWVNVADQSLVQYRANEAVISMRVVVGQDVEINQSPEFRATIQTVVFNPPWRVPDDIAQREIIPILDHDPNYLTQNNMVMLPGGGIEQLPGPDAGLGQLMFNMPNRFDVYLHDTPDKYLFNRSNRRVSHGCIRVQHPRDLAALLMQEPMDAIDETIATGVTQQTDLPEPMPVFVVYQTAFVDTDGELQFRPDFYNRDARIWQQLHRRPDSAVQADGRTTPRSPSGGARDPNETNAQAFLKSGGITARV